MDDIQKTNPFRHKSGQFKMAMGQTLTMNDLPKERLQRYRDLLAKRSILKEVEYNAILDGYLAEDNAFLKEWNSKKKKYEKDNPTVEGVHVDAMMGGKKKKPKPVFTEGMYKEKNVPADQELYDRVKEEAKQKFDVYPSLYANNWLVAEYKRRGGVYKMVKADDTVATALMKLLANTVSVYHEAHGFHWNVKGQDFAQYHALFAEIYSDLYESVDPIAENILKMGYNAPYQMSQLVALRTIPEAFPVSEPLNMALELLKSIEMLIIADKETFDVANKANEQGVANFLAELIDANQKWAWQLRSSVGLQKVNEHHGEGGRFASRSGGGAGGSESISPEASARLDRASSIQAAGPTKYTSASDIASEKNAMGTATKDQAIGKAHQHDRDFQSHSQASSDLANTATGAGDKRSAYEADSKKMSTEAAISFHLAGAWTAQAQSLGAKPSELMRKP